MDTKSVADLMECSSGVHFSGFHLDGLEQRKAGTEQPTTSDTDMYKQPFVIGVFLHAKLSVCVLELSGAVVVHLLCLVFLGSQCIYLVSCVCWVSSIV